jgi:hypothetical protein
MRRLAGALRASGARLRCVDADLVGIDLTDPRQLYEGSNFLTPTAHGDLDVFAVEQTPGAPGSYEQLSARAVAVEVLGVRLLRAHPDDLIRMKSAASLPGPAAPEAPPGSRRHRRARTSADRATDRSRRARAAQRRTLWPAQQPATDHRIRAPGSRRTQARGVETPDMGNATDKRGRRS